MRILQKTSVLYLFCILILATGCTKIRRAGDMTCRQPWSLWGMSTVECSIDDVPLRRGEKRTFTVLTNIVPNAVHVSLQGIRPGFNGWRHYLEKAEPVTMNVEFHTLHGDPLLTKEIRLGDVRKLLGPPHQTHGGVRDYARFELLNFMEHSDLSLDLRESSGYKIQLEVLEDGGGGKREGELVVDPWLNMHNRWTNFSGTLSRGESFRAEFDPFIFALDPIEHGWMINVYEQGRDESISRFTLPLHGPNPCIIEGWQFRNAANTGPNTGEVNQPQESRIFHFSPEVGRTIQPPDSNEQITEKELRRFELFGSGRFYINSLELSAPDQGGTAHIEKMSFRCWLEYRDSP